MPLCTELLCHRWEDLLGDWVTKDEVVLLKQLPTYTLTNKLHLVAALGKLRAADLLDVLRRSDILPEISDGGERRCVWVSDIGKRCARYHTQPVCKVHMPRAVVVAPQVFKSPILADAFRHYATCKTKMTLDNELALQRTMLFALTRKVQGDDIPFDILAAITALCDKIGGNVERMSKINTITPEVVERLLDKIVDIMGDYVDADRLVECSERIMAVSVLEPVSVIPYEPGDEVKAVDYTHKIEQIGKLAKQVELLQAERDLKENEL